MKNTIVDQKLSELSTTEPVSLDQAKSHLIITFTDDDTLITRLITAARRALENYCLVSLISKRIILTANISQEFELPYGPVTGIEAVETYAGTQGSGPASYQTAEGNWQTQGEEFLTFGAPAFEPDFRINNRWGCTGMRYRITYTAGYNPVPQDLVQALLVELAALYENRGDALEGKLISFEAAALANPYRRLSWL